MSKSWTATDVRMQWVGVFTQSGNVFDSGAGAELCLEGDYYFENEEGEMIMDLTQKHFSELGPIGDLPMEVQAAIQTLHDYYATQARAVEGI